MWMRRACALPHGVGSRTSTVVTLTGWELIRNLPVTVKEGLEASL